jgi:hypothetical protein
MKTHKWLLHAFMRTSGPVRSAPVKPPIGAIRFWATRGMLMTALVLSSLGAVVALSSHGVSDHASAQAAGYVAVAPAAKSTGSEYVLQVAWMY